MIYCVTGRPGSGKTTLLKTIEGRYAAKVHVIYADDIVKNTLYVEHHPCFSQLVSNFGEKVIAKENKDNKTIDRKVLLNIIFDNKEQQMKLQKIVWPFLRREISKQLISDKRPIKLVELGAYLNSDGEFDDLFDEVILIHRNDSSIYDTLREKNHWSDGYIEKFLNVFFSDYNRNDFKLIVDNIETLERAVIQLELLTGVFVSYDYE
ncbi:hypothetical protein ASO20_02295 [Mycoplasma sp. (ex Biomphalaria glabrata)]|uniref:dephospho-CoA kinase n=1 Tax=Mycoplasma sp. (ex Biomphalaria glabrata) TaxID=1749074 RepID=UPI00073ABC4C|nr:dephospho-CoA kinase [Mycoplasma sp. (ex Biomphalaria glabrata)]ALV23467.1 hypothetical protein ASO20_02295 [Mycoplasma sp. (ex Biomphalaria glabrata)]